MDVLNDLAKACDLINGVAVNLDGEDKDRLEWAESMIEMVVLGRRKDEATETAW